MTSIIDEIAPKLRRGIGDTEEPYIYSDLALTQYVEDAIDKLKPKISHNYTVDREEHSTESDISPAEQMLFALRGKLDILRTQPDFSYRTGTISVTRKSIGKRDLQKEIDDLIEDIIMEASIGLSNDEFDSYTDRFEQLLYDY